MAGIRIKPVGPRGMKGDNNSRADDPYVKSKDIGIYPKGMKTKPTQRKKG